MAGEFFSMLALVLMANLFLYLCGGIIILFYMIDSDKIYFGEEGCGETSFERCYDVVGDGVAVLRPNALLEETSFLRRLRTLRENVHVEKPESDERA